MRFDYLQLAEAMNVSPDGKVNVLGLGIRNLLFAQLPATARFAVLASIRAELSEVGSYDAEFRLEAPDGTEQELFRTSVDVHPDTDPSSTIMVIGLGLDVMRPFTEEGRYVLRAKVGEVSDEFIFRIRVGQPDSIHAQPALRPAKPASARKRAPSRAASR